VKPTKALTQVSIEFDGELFNLDLRQQALIQNDPEGLNAALAALPGEAALWGMLEQKAREKVERLEGRLEYAEAELYADAPGALEAQSRKPTVEAIKSWIVTNEKRLGLVDEVATARHELGMLTVGRQVMSMKKECALSLAANMRAEMDNQLHVAKRRMSDFYGGRAQ
jgi:hypothetical protein